MKTVSLISFIRNSVEDDYAMKVFYNIVKDSFVNNAAFLKSWGQILSHSSHHTQESVPVTNTST